MEQRVKYASSVYGGGTKISVLCFFHHIRLSLISQFPLVPEQTPHTLQAQGRAFAMRCHVSCVSHLAHGSWQLYYVLGQIPRKYLRVAGCGSGKPRILGDCLAGVSSQGITTYQRHV